MTFQAENFAEHYKAVRARLWPTQPKATTIPAPALPAPPLPPKRKPWLDAKRYDYPIGPRHFRKSRRLYRWPIGPRFSLPKKDSLKARQIVLETAEKHGFHPAKMLSHTRVKEVVTARHEAWLAVHDAYPEWSIAACARFFRINHTSLLHVLNKRRCESIPASLQSPESFVEGLG